MFATNAQPSLEGKTEANGVGFALDLVKILSEVRPAIEGRHK